MKITITADAFALTSAIAVSDITTLKKSNPSALKIRDEEGNDLFAVSYVEGKPSVSAAGITFGGKSRGEDDAAGKATFTGMIPAGVKDAKDYVAEVFASAITYLAQLEETVPAAAQKVATDRKNLVDSIEVI